MRFSSGVIACARKSGFDAFPGSSRNSTAPNPIGGMKKKLIPIAIAAADHVTRERSSRR